jgi:hypothetical protein
MAEPLVFGVPHLIYVVMTLRWENVKFNQPIPSLDIFLAFESQGCLTSCARDNRLVASTVSSPFIKLFADSETFMINLLDAVNL